MAEQVAGREGGGCAEHNIRFTCLSRRQQWWTSGLMDPERPPEHSNDALRLADVQYGARVPIQTQTQTPSPPLQPTLDTPNGRSPHTMVGAPPPLALTPPPGEICCVFICMKHGK